MANYLDGMDGGKHNSENTEASFTPRKLSCTLSGEYKRKHAPEFILRIDWKLLREQKFQIIDLIERLEGDGIQYKKDGETGLAKETKRDVDSLNGIISLIDSIQDYSIEELEIDEKEIFNLEEDE